jgi:hypothetical protein
MDTLLTVIMSYNLSTMCLSGPQKIKGELIYRDPNGNITKERGKNCLFWMCCFQRHNAFVSKYRFRIAVTSFFTSGRHTMLEG